VGRIAFEFLVVGGAGEFVGEVEVVVGEDFGRNVCGKWTAKVRSTATGRSLWTRLPPPAVREIEVEILRD
jgi:hypothetical protein